jgi:hypothetical protein
MRVYKPKGEHDDDFADLYPGDYDAEPKTRHRRKAAPDYADDVNGDNDNDDNDDYDGYLDNLTDPDDDEPYFDD